MTLVSFSSPKLGLKKKIASPFVSVARVTTLTEKIFGLVAVAA